MYCTNCGAKLKNESNFCGNCGMKIGIRKTKIEDNHSLEAGKKDFHAKKDLEIKNKRNDELPIEVEVTDDNNQTVSNSKRGFTLLWLILLYFSAVGNYYTAGLDEYAVLYGFLDLIIISFLLMVVPFILRIKNGEPLSFERGKSICKKNSWIWFAITIISMVLFEIGAVGGVGAIIYYYINMDLFVEKKCF